MLGQKPVKNHPEQRAAEDARQYDTTYLDWTHECFLKLLERDVSFLFCARLDSFLFRVLCWRLSHLHSHQPRDQDRQIELSGDSFGHRCVACLQSYRSDVA